MNKDYLTKLADGTLCGSRQTIGEQVSLFMLDLEVVELVRVVSEDALGSCTSLAPSLCSILLRYLVGL